MAKANMILRTLAAGAAVAMAGQALAAEPFSGPYVGVEAGWQQDRLKLSNTNDEGIEFAYKTNKSSFAYGGQIGYDYKVASNIVLGAEAFATGDSGKFELADAEVDAGRTFGLTARAGVLATPSTLVYAKGGWVNGRFSVDDGFDNLSRNRDGWTAGAGIEQMLTPNVSARVEYRYAKFNSFGNDDAGVSDVTKARFTRNAVMAGVNYRF